MSCTQNFNRKSGNFFFGKVFDSFSTYWTRFYKSFFSYLARFKNFYSDTLFESILFHFYTY
jgi:hypothetical protein